MFDGRKNNGPTLKTHRSDYQEILSQVDDPYRYSERRSETLDEKIHEAKERVQAFPDDKNEHESLIQLTLEAEAMWKECEIRLRTIANNGDVDRTSIAKKINQSHTNADKYSIMRSVATSNMLSNTSALYQAGESMRATGQTMQNAGDAMKSAGHSMTVGCTIPIIMLIILFFLFMFIF